jgi:hypothetical protein
MSRTLYVEEEREKGAISGQRTSCNVVRQFLVKQWPVCTSEGLGGGSAWWEVRLENLGNQRLNEQWKECSLNPLTTLFKAQGFSVYLSMYVGPLCLFTSLLVALFIQICNCQATTYVYRHHLKMIYCSPIHSRNQPRCPSDEWIKKMWHICTMEYYSAIKKNKIMLFAGKWTEWRASC